MLRFLLLLLLWLLQFLWFVLQKSTMYLEWQPKQCNGRLFKSCWSVLTASTLFGSWLCIIMAHLADLVSHLIIASVSLPLPLWQLVKHGIRNSGITELRNKQKLNSRETWSYVGSTVYLHYSPCCKNTIMKVEQQ